MHKGHWSCVCFGGGGQLAGLHHLCGVKQLVDGEHLGHNKWQQGGWCSNSGGEDALGGWADSGLMPAGSDSIRWSEVARWQVVLDYGCVASQNTNCRKPVGRQWQQGLGMLVLVWGVNQERLCAALQAS